MLNGATKIVHLHLFVVVMVISKCKFNCSTRILLNNPNCFKSFRSQLLFHLMESINYRSAKVPTSSWCTFWCSKRSTGTEETHGPAQAYICQTSQPILTRYSYMWPLYLNIYHYFDFQPCWQWKLGADTSLCSSACWWFDQQANTKY